MGQQASGGLTPQEAAANRTWAESTLDPNFICKVLGGAHDESTIQCMQVCRTVHHDEMMEEVETLRARSHPRDTCCLAWCLSSWWQEMAETETLQALHIEIGACVDLFKAEILQEDVMNGLLRCVAVTHEGMSAEDAATRIGQILCRWAAAQEPQFGLQIGVHTGKLHPFVLATSGKLSYFGPACVHARNLAQNCKHPMMVHLSRAAKFRLRKLERLPLMLAGDAGESYYLEAHTEVSASHGVASLPSGEFRGSERFSWTQQEGAGVTHVPIITVTPVDLVIDVPTVEEFEATLRDHGVDTAIFGTDGAMSIQDLHQDVAVQRRSHFVERGHGLERMMCVFRISLRAVGADGVTRELRLVSLNDDGSWSLRSQPLQLHLSPDEANSWEMPVESFFHTYFGIDASVQHALFSMDTSSFTKTEEEVVSRSVPLLKNSVMTQSLVINITDPQSNDLKLLGLPEAKEVRAGQQDWAWAPVHVFEGEDRIFKMLYDNDIDITGWSPDSFRALHQEVHEEHSATLERRHGVLTRTIRVIKVWVMAEVLLHTHLLVMKSKEKNGKVDDYDFPDSPVAMKMNSDDWEVALEQALEMRLGVNSRALERYFVVDPTSHKFTEEIAYSRTFPGLRTIYLVNEVHVKVVTPRAQELSMLGLPNGVDFTFTRQTDQGVVKTNWCWKPEMDLPRWSDRIKSLCRVRTAMGAFTDLPTETQREKQQQRKPPAKRRLPVPEPLPEVLKPGTGEPALAQYMTGTACDWKRARNAATRITQPDYLARDFYEDITAAFPELRLYVTGGETSSGRTPDDEYQRTMGALFAVFWLMRMHLDGRECFCYGLNADWTGPAEEPENPTEQQEEEWKKRHKFFQNTDWTKIGDLLVQAGVLLKQRSWSINSLVQLRPSLRKSSWSRGGSFEGEPELQPTPSSPAQVKHDVERTLTLLVLMAIHDIMKIQALLPQVSKKMKSYNKYQSGDIVNDHDIALSYILHHHPNLLPSYAGLSKAEQASVKFVHCKMEYNMGWLVQAEAPPGALFRTFREVILNGQMKPQDVGLYFVHWLADLAGAEPYPLEGCEKFVLKFPLNVLSQFLDSFSIIGHLGKSKNETKVFESYLHWRWEQQENLGPTPEGPGAVAKMRLVTMAQGDSIRVLQSFATLDESDNKVLIDEMSRTGCADQWYACEATRPGAPQPPQQGPAMLVYYAPALMQKLGRTHPRLALKVLAEVVRQARNLWPLSAKDANQSVTVRIDTLKEQEADALRKPDSTHLWLLTRLSNYEAVVRQQPITALSELDWSQTRVCNFSLHKPTLDGLPMASDDPTSHQTSNHSSYKHILSGSSGTDGNGSAPRMITLAVARVRS